MAALEVREKETQARVAEWEKKLQQLHLEKDNSSNNARVEEENQIAVERKKWLLMLEKKDHEISVLQETVHRECLERTSMLERMRCAVNKVVPCDTLNQMIAVEPNDDDRRVEQQHAYQLTANDDVINRSTNQNTGGGSLALFYEKLRSKSKKSRAKT